MDLVLKKILWAPVRVWLSRLPIRITGNSWWKTGILCEKLFQFFKLCIFVKEISVMWGYHFFFQQIYSSSDFYGTGAWDLDNVTPIFRKLGKISLWRRQILWPFHPQPPSLCCLQWEFDRNLSPGFSQEFWMIQQTNTDLFLFDFLILTYVFLSAEFHAVYCSTTKALTLYFPLWNDLLGSSCWSQSKKEAKSPVNRFTWRIFVKEENS